jgi:iron complex transport system substrate-binding protein
MHTGAIPVFGENFIVQPGRDTQRRSASHRGRYLFLAVIFVLFMAIKPLPGAKGESAPRRLVSLNLCTDQLLLTLAPRDHIAGLSFLAVDRSLSAQAEAAAGLPLLQGQAEEVLTLQPDLVLAGMFTARPTVALLQARGIRVMQVGLADDFDAIRQQIRTVAAAIGQIDRGEAVIAEMDATLAAARPTSDVVRPRALTLAPGAFTAGAGTLTDAAMRAAGLENYAAAKGLKGYGYLSLEQIAADPPDLLLVDGTEGKSPSLNGQLLAHPALARAIPAGRRPAVPGWMWTCGGPFTAGAVQLLAAARDRFLKERAP